MQDKELKQIQSEVDEMNKALGAGPEKSGEEETATDAPTTEEPMHEEDDSGREDGTTSGPRTNAPATNAPTTEAPTTEEPEEDKDAIIEDLRKKLVEKESASTKAPGTSAPTTEAPLEEHDFVGDLDPDKLWDNKEELNKILNSVYAKGVEVTKQRFGGQTIANLPEQLGEVVARITTMQKIRDQFYEVNEDLKKYQPEVAAAFGKAAEENPEALLEDLLKETEKAVRTKLHLKPKPKEKPADDDTPPRLPGRRKRGARGEEQPKLTPQEQQIEEMNKSLRR